MEIHEVVVWRFFTLSFDLGNRNPETLFDVRAFAFLLKSLILFSALKMRIYGNTMSL